MTAAFAASGVLALPAAGDEGTDVVTALVAPGSRTDKDGSYYVLDADPGDTITQTIVVRNDRPHEVEAHVEAVDAFTRDATGAGYGAPGSTPTGTGTWIVVSTPVLTLAPGEERAVDFTVHVPEDAGPGQYLAGMSAAVPLSTSTTTVSVPDNVADVNITLQGQRLIAVQVNVAGPVEPKLVVTGVRPTATPDGLALLLALENQGNAFARGSGTVRVNSTGLQTDFDIDTFVSGTKIDYRVIWTDEVIAGVHDVAVQLRYGDRQVAWNGKVEISGALQRELQQDLDELTITESAGDTPLGLLVGLGLGGALCCAAAAVVIRRRRTSQFRLAPGVN